MAVDRRRFGQTDLWVSPLCQGTAFRTLPRADGPEARAVLAHALDSGVNFFDSSNAYGWGGAEEVLGKALAGRRTQAVICTKVAAFAPPNNGEGKGAPMPFTRANLFAQAEASLKRLGTDYLDLYLLHQPDNLTPPAEIAQSMAALVESGKVRHWGVSNHSGAQLREYLELQSPVPPAGAEEYYNVAGEHLDAEGKSRAARLEAEVFPLLRQSGMGLLAFSPLDTGFLDPGRAIAEGSPLAGLAAALDQVAVQLGCSRTQLCIAWVRSCPEVSCVLAGAESPAQVEENCQGAQLTLPPEARVTIEEARQLYRQQQAAAQKVR
ncbi:MAG: aldo/keto reductase [Candidatus Handelsmanbacteria bacterium]|nr:aldo/keto reductase [Candidatus Handelsmanbacteria bacterium]